MTGDLFTAMVRRCGLNRVAAMHLACSGVIGAFGTALSAEAVAVEPARTVLPVPAGFGIAAIGRLESAAFYAEFEGGANHGVDRETTELICNLARTAGRTSHTPTFDAGWDEPSKVTEVLITGKHFTASFTTTHPYACDVAGNPGYDICSCHFQPMPPVFRAHIAKFSGGVGEVIEYELPRRKGQRRLLGGKPYIDADATAALAAYPAAAGGRLLGVDVVAGTPCTEHRYPGSTPESWSQWCVTGGSDLRVDPALRNRRIHDLVQSSARGVTKLVRETRAVRLIPNAVVDAGILLPPADVVWKTVDTR